ncbi:MAG: hypothetical protein EPO23_14320 [Xanthobacteraceae bacterium]|nr:MAG: hypothetical protein EPO23_14320 [Xanthobacteraceae bacterium]
MAAIIRTARIVWRGAATLAVLALAGGMALTSPATAQGARDAAVTRANTFRASGEFSAQRRRRAPLRVRVQRAPGAVLERPCVAWYVEEARPSGTVITPRMQCWWALR